MTFISVLLVLTAFKMDLNAMSFLVVPYWYSLLSIRLKPSHGSAMVCVDFGARLVFGNWPIVPDCASRGLFLPRYFAVLSMGIERD